MSLPPCADPVRPALLRLTRPLFLASASPRREAFLREMGLACTVLAPPEHAEPFPALREAPDAFAARAARAKAEAVASLMDERVQNPFPAVLGADTVVILDGRIFGKPRNGEEAFQFVRDLAGREHRVHTACCLCLGNGDVEVFAAEAFVRMGAWPEAVLRAYAACGEGLDKAGAYAVQGVGAFLVEAVRGSWSAVIGLPMAETVAALLRRGVAEPL